MQSLPAAASRAGTALMCLVLVAGAAAQSSSPESKAPPAAAKAAKPPRVPLLVEPRAIDLIKATSARLAAAKAMSFTAIVDIEYPSKLGPPLAYPVRYDVAMQRPDKLRVLQSGAGAANEFTYDGKLMMAFVPEANLVAVADAPPTIEAALKLALDRAALYYPFMDLLLPDPYAAMTDKVLHAFYIGPSGAVGGVATEAVAWATNDVFIQMWVGTEDKPTILEAAGLKAPTVVDGIEQKPIEGTSFLYTFDATNAKAPERHKTQYFEMMGQWALYDEGWFLSTKVNRAPWDAFGPANPDPLNNQVLELYHLNKDFSQTQDLAAKYPDKVKAMKAKFIAEAKKHQVFPLDASVAARIVAPRPNITAGRSEFVYTRPMVGLPQGDSPLLLNTSYTVTADIDVPAGGAEGMILTSGGRFGGYGFYLLKGKPVWLWNLVDLERLKWEGAEALAPGRHTIEFDFKYEGLGAGTLAFNDFSGVGRPGVGTLKVDGKVVDTKPMPRTLPMILQWDESFDIGSDTLTGVNDADYKPPFALTAKLNRLTVKLDRPQLSPADIARLQAAMKTKD